MKTSVPLEISGFPDVPALKARWAPIFLEPIHNSGERLTVAIVVKTGNQAQIRSVVRPDAMRMLYGSRAGGLRGLVELVVDSLDAHLKAHKTPSSWKAPVSGFHWGEFRPAASSSIEGIVAQAIQLCASLSSLTMVELAREADKIDTEQVTSRVVDRVRDVIRDRRVDLLPYFNQSGKLVEDGRPVRFGFLGKGVVAHFGQLRPVRIFNTQFSARARLWELSRAQQLLKPRSACLILQVPRKRDINFTAEELRATENAFGELVEEAQDDKLSVLQIHDENEGADEIIKLAA